MISVFRICAVTREKGNVVLAKKHSKKKAYILIPKTEIFLYNCVKMTDFPSISSEIRDEIFKRQNAFNILRHL